MAKIHVKGGSDLQIKFTDESDNDLYPVVLDPVKSGPWYNVKHNNSTIQANKRKPNDKYYFRSKGDMEIDFKST